MNTHWRTLLLLIAGNVVLFIWYLIVPEPKRPLPSTVSTARLIHKQELDLITNSVPVDPLHSMDIVQQLAPETSAEPLAHDSSQCFMLGPFADKEQLSNWFSDIGHEFEVRDRRIQDVASPFYRAYSPAVGNRASAVVLLTEIRGAIQRSGAQIDSYIVPSGPLENAISLGLFSDQVNALNVQRILGGQRINVLVEPEVRFISGHWLVAKIDYYPDFKRKIDSVATVLPQAVSMVENLCETIAQAE